MFKQFFKAITHFFIAPTTRTPFEETVLQEEVKKQEPVVVDTMPTHGSHATSINDQITDSVTQAVHAKPKRAKTAKGKFKADDTSTTDVNEAWEGGKAPAKKPRTPRKKKPTSEA